MARAYLEPAEIEALERAAMSMRDRLLIRLLFRLGCRVSEALALRVEDIDFTNGVVTIQHLKTRLKLLCPQCNAGLAQNSVYCARCGLKVEKTVIAAKKRRRLRTLPIDGDTLAMLADFIEKDHTEGLIFGINRHRAWQVVSSCAQRAGLPDLVNPETGKAHHISLHRLRDAFAVNAVKTNDTGDGLRLLQVHLGHASFNTTAKYRKVSGEEQREWYESLWQKAKRDGTLSKMRAKA